MQKHHSVGFNCGRSVSVICNSHPQSHLDIDQHSALMLDIRGMTAALAETTEKIDGDVSRLLTRIQTRDDGT
jgi:hypothetical protein